MNWLVSQIGAREDYAVARALERIGRLECLFTDVWCRVGASWLRRGPAGVRALAGRQHVGVPDRKVTSFSPTFMAERLRSQLKGSANSGESVSDEFLRIGELFDHRVAARLRSLPAATAGRLLFAYNTGCLESLKAARELGAITLVDQIDPGQTEQDIVEDERRRWPGWDSRPGRLSEKYYGRLMAEWDRADGVVVNSDWSAEALSSQGVPREKIHVVPLAYQPPSLNPAVERDFRSRPLVALWLGQVILRKGIPYVFEAARRLQNSPWRFDIVGPLGITPEAIRSAPSNVHILGPVTRDRAQNYYESSHVFLLPTLSDGFAITQIEAMAFGLPVIATPRCGKVVSHEHDGLVIPPGDPAALADALQRLADEPDLLRQMSANALAKSKQFSVPRLSDELAALESKLAPRSTLQQPAGAARLETDTPTGGEWIVTLIGARQDYAAARALHRRLRLDRLYTDAWCRFGASVLSKGPRLARAFAGRFNPELRSARVVDFAASSFLQRFTKLVREEPKNGDELADDYLRVGDWFDRRVVSHLQCRPHNPGTTTVFCYNTGCLQTLRWARSAGLFAIVDQIDPARDEQSVVDLERQRWPGWEIRPGRLSDRYFDRLSAEWDAADRVVVNSDWSAEALVRQGVDREKIAVIPLAFEPPRTVTVQPRTYDGRPLIALWLGQVVLRKGIPYVLEAARKILDTPWRIDIVGTIEIARSAVESAPANVRFLGPVTRGLSSACYQTADAFLLPTLSDGFAITQLEAMAHGVPVIATERCGRVVTHGHDGWIVPPADADSIAQTLRMLADDRDQLARCAANAPITAQRYTLDRMGRDLMEIENDCRRARRQDGRNRDTMDQNLRSEGRPDPT